MEWIKTETSNQQSPTLFFESCPACSKTTKTQKKKSAGVGTIFIKDSKVLTVFRNNTAKNNNKHGLIGGRIENKENNQHVFIEWVDLDNLPANLIPRNRQALENMQRGIAYSEYG